MLSSADTTPLRVQERVTESVSGELGDRAAGRRPVPAASSRARRSSCDSRNRTLGASPHDSRAREATSPRDAAAAAAAEAFISPSRAWRSRSFLKAASTRFKPPSARVFARNASAAASSGSTMCSIDPKGDDGPKNEWRDDRCVKRVLGRVNDLPELLLLRPERLVGATERLVERLVGERLERSGPQLPLDRPFAMPRWLPL